MLDLALEPQDLSGEATKENTHAARGGYSTIYKGEWRGIVVCEFYIINYFHINLTFPGRDQGARHPQSRSMG